MVVKQAYSLDLSRALQACLAAHGSPYVHVGSLRVLYFPPTIQRHVRLG